MRRRRHVLRVLMLAASEACDHVRRRGLLRTWLADELAEFFEPHGYFERLQESLAKLAWDGRDEWARRMSAHKRDEGRLLQ